MNNITAKRVIIGGGLAGCAAALVRPEGTFVVASDTGASGISSGALDVCGDPLSIPGKPRATSTDVNKNILRLLSRNPHHPYHYLLRGADSDILFTKYLEPALEALFPRGYLLAGSIERNRPLLTAAGTVKFTALSATNIAAALEPCIANPLVMGLLNFGDLDPEFWLKSAKDMLELLGEKMGGYAAWLNLGLKTEVSSLELARQLIYPQTRDRFMQEAKDALARHTDATCLVIPAILPAEFREKMLADMEKELGRPVREVLALPPSVPGARLAGHLESRLRDMGVQLIRGQAHEPRVSGDTVEGIVVACADGETLLSAEQFILAGGSFVGGGLKNNGAFIEPLFDLPVFSADRAIADTFSTMLTEHLIRRPHRLFASGIKVDENLRPLGLDGKPRFKNLAAAGAIIQGSNPHFDHTGSATAIATGWAAGREA